MGCRIAALTLACAWLMASPPTRAEEPAAAGQADEAAEGEAQAYHFKITAHLMAPKVGFDKKGRCKVARGRKLKAWRVPRFPAQIPAFESCLTVKSKDARGLMDLEFNILDKAGESLQRVEGAIDLGDKGTASQAVNWEHVEIPQPGLYHMQVLIEGQEVARYPMRFNRRGGKRRAK